VPSQTFDLKPVQVFVEAFADAALAFALTHHKNLFSFLENLNGVCDGIVFFPVVVCAVGHYFD
jgi:hypothetical protein